MTKKHWIWLVIGLATLSQMPTMFMEGGKQSSAAASRPAPKYVVLSPEEHCAATGQCADAGLAEIDPVAIEPYTADQYPTTVAKFGSAVPKLNADREKAAEIGSKDGRCDHVQNAQITTRSPRVNRRYWVECKNLTRLFFDEKSLGKGKAVDVQTFADMRRDGLQSW